MMQTTCMGGMWHVGMWCRWQENMAPVVRPDASIGAQNRASWEMASRWEGERAGLSGRDGEGGADDQHHPHPHQLVSLMPPSLLPHHDMDDVHA